MPYWVSLGCSHPTAADIDLGCCEPVTKLVFVQVWLCDSQQLQATMQVVTEKSRPL